MFARKKHAHAQTTAFAESRKTTAKKHQEENIKPFTFYDIYYAPIKALDDKQAGKFFRMICDFLDGNQPETDGKDTPEFELYWESIVDNLSAYRRSTGKSCGLDKRYRHFPFLPFYRKAFSYLNDEDGGAFIKLLGAYMFENRPPKETESNAFKYFSICKRKLDESKLRMQNGAKGGRPKKGSRSPQERTSPGKHIAVVRKEDENQR